MFSLKDKTALVTGAGSGIGESIAKVFAKAGAKVWVADINTVEGQRVADEINAGEDGSATFIELDVSSETNCASAAKTIGELNVLVNNAGIGHVGTMVTTKGEDLDRMYSVNVRGTFNVTKVFIEQMVERKSGAIVNMASIGGVVGVKDRLAYCATKFAVAGLTKAMAIDHATDGVRVNCICPGRVETPFVKKRLSEYPDPEAAYREMASTQAQGRMGTPDEIAYAALYLAADESGFVTGTEFIIDGGWTAGK